MKKLLLVTTIAIALTGCSKDENTDGLSTEALSAINGDEGTELVITENNIKINSYGKNVLGFENIAAFSPENTVRGLRILSDDYKTLNLWYILGKEEDFVEAAVGINSMQPNTLELTQAAYRDEIYGECFVDGGDLSERIHFTGTIEILRDVEYLGAVYEMVGLINVSNNDTKITGVFWKQNVTASYW